VRFLNNIRQKIGKPKNLTVFGNKKTKTGSPLKLSKVSYTWGTLVLL